MMRSTWKRSNARSSSGIRRRINSCWSVSPSVQERFGSSVLAVRLKRSVVIMKKTRTAKKSTHRDQDMLPEYRFDYSKARPNRFAGRVKPGCRAVVLDPDVAEVFATPE